MEDKGNSKSKQNEEEKETIQKNNEWKAREITRVNKNKKRGGGKYTKKLKK